MGENSGLELRLFGPPCLSSAGVLLRFPSRKGLAVLLLLALDGAQSRERLAVWLWPDSPTPRDALRNCLAQINKVLAAANIATLEADRQRVAWPVAGLWVDARELESNNPATLEALVRGLPGAWLDGLRIEDAPEFESWMLERGAFYSGILQGKLEVLIDRALQSGRLEPALGMAQQRLRLDALNEGAYRQLMRVQRSAGRDAEARETLLLCQSTLARELGVTPSAKTLGLLLEPLPKLQTGIDTPIGRSLERDWLERLRSRHGLAFFSGEAGAGKTTLLRDIFSDAIWLECRPNDASLPFSSVLRGVRRRLRDQANLAESLPTWARLELSRFLPELHESPIRFPEASEPLERTRLYAAFSLLFPNALALIVDDVHFMDDSSAAWLWQLVQQRLDDALAATVLAYRPDDLSTESQTVIHQLDRFAESRRLEPLSPTDLAVWLPRFSLNPNLAENFFKLTGGNALFFKEAASAYAASGQFESGLMPLLKRRLQALSKSEWQLTQFVAVANAESSFALATQVLRSDQLLVARTWARLEALDILNGSRFAHDLLRDAALELMPAMVQTALANTLLEAFEFRVRQGESMPMALLAEAAAKANDARRETHYRLRASLETYQLGLIRAGIAHLERALKLLTAQPITGQVTLATNDDLEMLYFKLTPIFRADVYSTPNLSGILERLLVLARARGLTHFEALTLALQADVLASTTHNTDQARTLFAQALELVGTNLPVKAVILELLAWCENTAGNTRLALGHANELLALVVPLFDPNLEYRALEAVCIFEQNLCLWPAARDHALRAASVALQGQYARIGRPYMLSVVAHCALNLGDLELAERQVRTALELFAEGEWHNGLGFAKRTLAGILLERDDLSQALELARASVDHNQAIEQHFATFTSLLLIARIESAAGRAQNALETLDCAEQTLARVFTLSVVTLAQGFLDAWRCIIKTQLGQPAIHDALRSVQARANVSDSTVSWLLFPRETELEVLWNAGHQEIASREFEAFLELHPDNPKIQILHDRARAVMLTLNGDSKAAQELLERTQQKSLELGLVMQARLVRVGF